MWISQQKLLGGCMAEDSQASLAAVHKTIGRWHRRLEQTKETINIHI